MKFEDLNANQRTGLRILLLLGMAIGMSFCGFAGTLAGGLSIGFFCSIYGGLGGFASMSLWAAHRLRKEGA